MSTSGNDPRAVIRYACGAAVVTLAVVWAAYLVRDALLLIYVSAIIAIGLSPIVTSLERSGFTKRGRLRPPRWLSILIIYLAVLGLFVGIGLLVVPPLIDQAQELWARLPELLHQGQRVLMRLGLLSREMTVLEAMQRTPVAGADAAVTVAGAIWGLVGGVFGLVTILILAFYLLVDANNIASTFVRLFPRGHREQVATACQRISTKVSAWLAGQLLLAAIVGTTAGVGLFLLGVPYFYVLALIAGIGETIPIVGPVLAAVPALIVALSVSPALALGVLAFLFLQQQLENHILVPRIMSRQVGVSSVVVIVALLIGGSLLGILGAILAVPTAAVLQVLFEELAPDDAGA